MTQLQSKTDRYNIIEERGQGGFGITYRATRSSDNKEVIVKTLRVERMKEWKSFELFEREASVMRQLSHPNIPAYVDFFTQEDSGLVAIVQEFIDGQDLRHRMKHGPRLTEPEMISWLSQILQVLTYLHRLSPPVIHRDISPKNILLRPDGKAYLIDFGAVQAAVLSASTLASTSAGTFGYAPLEQFMGRAFPQSDLYGLAMTFLAVSTGREPEEFPLQGIKVDIRQLVRLDARLHLLLEAMTEPDPGKRLGDAQEALERLAPILPAAPVAPVVAPRAPAQQREAAPARSARVAAPTQNARGRARGEAQDVMGAAWVREQLARQDGLQSIKPLQASKTDTIQNFVLSSDGTQLLLVGWEKSVVVDLDALTCERQDKLQDKAFNDEESCVSPDLRLIARKKGSSIQLQRADDKRVLQSVNAADAKNLAFSPDGHFLLYSDWERVVLLGQRGEKIELPGEAAAFSSDGRYFALSAKNQVRVGEAQIEGNLLRWGNTRTEPNRGGSVKIIAFSHDQRQVVVLSEKSIYLLSTQRDEPPVTLESLPRGETEPTNVGFTADDKFVVVCGEFRAQRYSNKNALGAFLWRRDGSYVGALVMAGGELQLRLDEGFFYGVGEKPQRGDAFWCREEVLRSYREGTSIVSLLSVKDQESLKDLDARYQFLNQLRRKKALSINANLTAALQATAGATPYLPLILEEAKKAGDGPRFGANQDEEQLSAQKIAEATVAFMKRPAGERQVLLEDHLRRLEASLVQVVPEESTPRASTAPEDGYLQGAKLPASPREVLPELAFAEATQGVELEQMYQEAKTLEQKEDSKWFRRKDYTRALELFSKVAMMGHSEAADAVRRVTEKMS